MFELSNKSPSKFCNRVNHYIYSNKGCSTTINAEEFCTYFSNILNQPFSGSIPSANSTCDADM